MPTPFATHVDYTTRGYTNPFAATDILDARLAAASRHVRALLPEVDARIDRGLLDPELVADIVCKMVQRSVPADELAGLETVQHTAGPFAQSLRPHNPAGDLYLTKAERRALGLGQRAGEVDPLARPSDESSSSP